MHRKTAWLQMRSLSCVASLLMVGVLGCQSDGLAPTACGDALCEDGLTCVDSVCADMDHPCTDAANPDYLGWPAVDDYEPNGVPELATTLPCGDDPLADPEAYAARCPYREDYTNFRYQNVMICPPRERDVFAFHLFEGETLEVYLMVATGDRADRDLDLRVLRWDDPSQAYVTVTESTSPGDLDHVQWSTGAASGHPAGWYYIQVHGKTDRDVNTYRLEYTLNPTDSE